MTVSTLTPSAVRHHSLLPVLDAAVHASREAHEATQALTDTVLACRYLPAEVYQYAPYVSDAAVALTAASRALITATGSATVHPTADNLRALAQATADLTTAIASLRYQTGALAAAADWYSASMALAPGSSAN